MELPQPYTFGPQGRKPTHDFLTLYSPAQQDPILPPPGGYLKTHDFLQPLERIGKNVAKRQEITSPPIPTSAAEHILPSGIETCNIRHISYINQNQRLPRPEGVMNAAAQLSNNDRNDENPNCSSYTDNGFTLWEESAGKKGKTGKENIASNRHVIREGDGVPWTTSMERPSHSSSIHNHPTTNMSSHSSSCPSSAQKKHSFVDMLKSARTSQEDEDDDNEDIFIKKEPSSHHKGILSVKVETDVDQKPKTPRSKHSATEQRRRSKINDRFSKLREIIPHCDQRRDKASFLSEVIEYIQFLQKKVDKYEGNDPPKIIPWSERPTEAFNGAPGAALAYGANIPTKGENTLDSSDMNYVDSTKDPELRDKLKEKELKIENGRINISTVYSKGLSSSVSQTIERCGVELSEASISVQIEVGKRANQNHSLKDEGDRGVKKRLKTKS